MCNVYRAPELESRFGKQKKVIEKVSNELRDRFEGKPSISDLDIEGIEDELETLVDALGEADKFQQRKKESSIATSDVLFLFNHIRGQKFAVIPMDHQHKNQMCDVRDKTARAERFFVQKNHTQMCVEIAGFFLSRVVMSGVFCNGKVGVIHARVQDEENNTKSLPVDRTAFLFDEPKLHDWIKQSAAFTDMNGEAYFRDFVTDECYVMMLG